MIRLALTDLDDTLVPLAQHGLAPARAIEAIHEVIDAGLRFGPVTGRVPSDVHRTFGGDERCYATGAFANGQMVRLDGEVIHREFCPMEALQRVADIMDDVGEGALALYDVEGTGNAAWFVSRSPERVASGFGWALGSYESRPVVEAPSLKANVHVEGTRDHLVRVRDLLRDEVPDLDFVFPSRTAPLIDITPRGYGKGSAVVLLAEALGIGVDEVVTFGDSENDVTMLSAVPNSVVVANGSEEAKRVARWRIGPSADGAVSDALLDIAAAARIGSMPAFMRA